MHKLIYTPKALEDLRKIKSSIVQNHGADIAQKRMRQLTTIARELEHFSEAGPSLGSIIQFPTEYRYLVVKPNYIIYRVEIDVVKVIRVLNEKQDFMQILFGMSDISEEGEDYWRQFDE